MTTRFISILARQRPFPIGLDAKKRSVFSMNFDALAAAPVDAWEECIATVIVNAGLGVVGTTIIAAPQADLSTSDGPLISIVDTGGMAPFETHDNAKYERLSVQILTRGMDYSATRTRALAIWRALHGLRNVTIAA